MSVCSPLRQSGKCRMKARDQRGRSALDVAEVVLYAAF